MFKKNVNFSDYVQCLVLEMHLSPRFEETSCWNLARRLDDFRFTYNVCQDCIVYIYSQEMNEPDREHIEKALKERTDIQPKKS